MKRLLVLIALAAWLGVIWAWKATAPKPYPSKWVEPEDGLPAFDPWLDQQAYDRGLLELLEAVR